MMIALLLLADAVLIAQSDLSPMQDAVAKCDRDAMVALGKAEPHRRADFALSIYAEQSAIAAERAGIATHAPASASGTATPAGRASLETATLSLDARQKRLEDAKQVEQARRAATDEMRADFLANCDSRKRG